MLIPRDTRSNAECALVRGSYHLVVCMSVGTILDDGSQRTLNRSNPGSWCYYDLVASFRQKQATFFLSSLEYVRIPAGP